MRVLEAGNTPTYKMGKNRKHRIRKGKENEAEESSDDGVLICSHIPKAINFAAMRKAITKPACTLGECTTCASDASKSGAKDLFGSPVEGAAAAIAADESDGPPSIWVCLQCGHQGCDRSSRERHALKHYETPHSGIHCLVANLTTWSAWCYTCDSEVPVESSKRIQECVDFLRKHAGLPRLDTSHSAGLKCFPAGQSNLSPTEQSPPSTRSDKITGAKPSAVVCQKVKGLNNLGNTCFFNAVMQNLCQTHSFEALLLSRCKKGGVITIPGFIQSEFSDSDSSADGDEDENSKDRPKDLPAIEVSVGEPGPLTQSLLQFVQEMNNGSAQVAVNPGVLFGHVCKKAPRFKGFQQQDSHELLRYLVDVVRNEEIKRAQSGILKYFKLSESTNPKKVEEETKLRIKEYGRQVKYTFLDSLFGGRLVSIVMCEECKHISQVFEPFLDLSLPVTEEKPQRPNQPTSSKRKESVTSLQTSVEPIEEVSKPKGIDGFVENPEKPNKFLERKNKRLAKKEAKKKERLAAGKVGNNQQAVGDCSKDEEEKDSSLDTQQNQTQEASRNGSDSQQDLLSNGRDDENENSSLNEDPSDADVEDNLESETSRLQGSLKNDNMSASMPDYARVHACNMKDQTLDCKPDSDLQIKIETEKKHHILPSNSSESGDSPPSSLDSNPSIKDMREIEKNVIKHSNRNKSFIKESKEIDKEVIEADMSSTSEDAAYKEVSEKTVASDMHSHPCKTDLDNKEHLSENTAVVFNDSLMTNGFKEDKEKPSIKSVINDDLMKNGLEKDKENRSQQAEEDSILDYVDSAKIEDFGLEIGIQASASHSETGLEKDFREKLTIGERFNGERDNFPVGVSCRGQGSGEFVHTDNPFGVGNVKDKQETNASNVPFTSRASDGNIIANGVFANEGINLHSTDKKFSHQNHMDKTNKGLSQDAKQKVQITMAPRYHPCPKECSVMSCLHQFTAAELLTGSNKVGCKNCTHLKSKNATQSKDKKSGDVIYSNASKQYLIMAPPAILTLHLKRFEQVGYTSRKVNRHVDFPSILDLAPYCSSLCSGVKPNQKKVLYSLYGVVEHSGRLSGGHYTAYVKVRPSLGPLTNFLQLQNSTRLDYIHKYMEQIQNGSNSREEETFSEDPSPDTFNPTINPPGRWFHISDSRFNEVPESAVLRAQAYLLFYERIY